MSIRKLRAFLQLTRPLFLAGGAVLYGLGVAIAVSQGSVFDPGHALLGQGMVTATQVMTHYSNEYYDLEGDRLLAGENRTFFSGGSGILPGGGLSPGVALYAARVCAVLALVLIGCVASVQPAVGLIGLIAFLGSWFYSTPPVALMGSGWGELTTSLIVGLLAPLTGCALQAGGAVSLLLQACLPLVLLHWAMMIAFEFPDYEADHAVGKRTLTVRVGRERAARVHNALIAGALLLMAISGLTLPAARCAWLAAPLAVWQIAGVSRRARAGWTRLSRLTLGAVSLFALTALLWLIGFMVFK